MIDIDEELSDAGYAMHWDLVELMNVHAKQAITDNICAITFYKDVLGAMMPLIFSTFTSLELTKKEVLDAMTYIIKKHYSEEKQ